VRGKKDILCISPFVRIQQLASELGLLRKMYFPGDSSKECWVIVMRAFSIISIFTLFGLIASTATRAQEIWIAPQGGVEDRMDLFKPEAPWKNAASHTQVFKFYANKAFNMAPQEEVDIVIADLKRRGIALALEAGVMNVAAKPKPPCGGWGMVEGYGPVEMHDVIARKIKNAGGVIKYIAMDEPLWYGHYFKGKPNGQPGCQISIGDVAKLIAPSLAVYTREFPGVIIGDIEPSNALARQPNWKEDLTSWATEYRAAVGRPLAFIQLDAAWAEPGATESIRTAYSYAKDMARRGLLGKIGIIYNGNGKDPSDSAWVQSARDHVFLMERNYGLHPDQAIFQSWDAHPAHALPETSPDTLTSLIDFYVAK
jgi:hypothetical protein